MTHLTTDVTDLPALPPIVNRRRRPDRRAVWRGGRRDSDWVNRPPGAWQQLESRQKKARTRPGLLRMAVSALHLW